MVTCGMRPASSTTPDTVGAPAAVVCMARRLMLINIRLRWGHRPWFHPMGKLLLPYLIMLGICLWNISLLRALRIGRVNRIIGI